MSDKHVNSKNKIYDNVSIFDQQLSFMAIIHEYSRIFVLNKIQ